MVSSVPLQQTGLNLLVQGVCSCAVGILLWDTRADNVVDNSYRFHLVATIDKDDENRVLKRKL